jgi:hypothetical protein
MKTISYGILAFLLVTVCAVSQTHSAEKTRLTPSDRERLIGAWRLVSIAGQDGNLLRNGVPTGMLIYTRDGHMSVQLMYPRSENALSNEYVQNGYEASFGSYDVNEITHTVTHHVQGANTGNRLVGKDLPRVYQLNGDERLIIRSARPEERWFVTWEHY